MSTNFPKDMRDAQREAFSRFGASCLWSKRPVDAPTAVHLRIIARCLKSQGGKRAYAMARKLEEISDAADRSAKTHP